MSIPLSALRRLRTFGVGGGGDPFTWYPALNKALIPFHAGAGEWGAQSLIKEPSAPVTTSTGSVSNNTQMADALYTGGVQITLSDDLPAGTFNDANIVDADVIIPPGALWHSPSLGGFTGETVNRMRIRGNTVGVHSGGQLHKFDLVGTGANFILDGIDVSGTYLYPAINFGSANGYSRGAVVNCRIISGGFCIGSTCSDMVVAGCSIISGMDTAAETSPTNEEAYGIRFYHETLGNAVVYACDIRSNPARVQSSHARIRCHPDTGLDYVYVSNCKIVERVENWIFLVSAGAGGGNGDCRAAWLINNEIIAGSSGTTGGADVPKISIVRTPEDVGTRDAAYFYCSGNTIKSTDFVNNASITNSAQGEVNGAAGVSGNTFEALPGSDGPWLGAGDPTGITWNI